MTPATSELFSAILSDDINAVQRALAAGADVNATDERGRNVMSYAALGTAIDVIDATIQPRLSERRLAILQLITQEPELSLYSLNAPMAWAGGVTLLSLMSWLNMPSEIMSLLDFTHGLLEVNAMDDHGATPLMCMFSLFLFTWADRVTEDAARDGNLQVVQRLLAHGARPDLKDVSQRSAIEYALPHPQLQWLCEEALRRSRQSESTTSSISISNKPKFTHATPYQFKGDPPTECLFFSPQRLLSPPSMALFDAEELRRTFDTLLCAIRHHDVDTFRNVLFSTGNSYALTLRTGTPPSFGTFLLVNLRDSTGLTLTHHVVCQRPCPNIAILDALHSAGCDVGLFSALGFSPLHHLSRTARDDANGPEQGHSRSPLNPRTHPLYIFTMHLVRDLRTPLRATDYKDETPLHSAAEHGRSLSVLLAMLDCDREFSGKAAIREMRNERGLRPVDVARPEFIPLFLGRHQSHPTLPSKVLSPPNNQRQHTFGAQSYGSSHIRSNILMRQESHASLMSKSSSSSSRSSGTHSISSQWSAYRSNSHRFSMRTTPVNALPTPEATPPRPFTHSSQAASSHESYFPIDAPACSVDVLNHLSFCANTLHAYKQLYTSRYDTGLYGMDAGTLPEFHVLADLLLFTRDLASHVLEHWTARLDTGWDEFERARRDLGKAKALRVRVGRDVNSMSSHLNSHVKSNNQVEARLQLKSGRLQVHTSVQTDLDIPASVQDVDPAGPSSIDTNSPHSSSTETATQTLSRVDWRRKLVPRLKVSVGRPYILNSGVVSDEDTVVTGSVNLDRKRLTSEFVSDEDCAVGRGAMGPTSRRPSNPVEVPFPRVNMLDSELLTSPQDVSMVSVILQRTDQDLSNVLACFAIVQQSYIHAQESIDQTRLLIEESIKVREDKLNTLMKIYHKLDLTTHPSRLSPILERSSEAKGCDDTAPSADSGVIAALGPIEESHSMRRLLMHKLANDVEQVFDNLQKAHVWLRIIREVLRGLRRRVLVAQL